MISPPRPKANRGRQQGFTLVEVSIALGILSTGMLLLFSLMPTGIGALHEASKKSMGRRIAQNIVSDMMVHEWDKLHEFDSTATGGSIRYFDDFGIELRDSQKDLAIFRARVRVIPRDVVLDLQNALPSTPSYLLPDDPNPPNFADGTLTNLRRIHVDITSTPGDVFDTATKFGTGTVTDSRVRTYTAIISNMMDTDTIINSPINSP